MDWMHYEGVDLAEQGEGAKFVQNGAVMLDGRIPVDPSGGLKSRGHPVGATSLAQICELVWQLPRSGRGPAGSRRRREFHQTSGGALVGQAGVSVVTILWT